MSNELARRAVACKGWQWMAGMLTLEGYRLDNSGRLKAEQQGDQLPDLNDPATVGCLVALVRKAWGEPTAHAVPFSDGTWYVQGKYIDDEHGHGDTEAEALVRALEFKDPDDDWYVQ